ncbi:hypothetical protein CEXT_598051 [Caerostris extrusa]|uniref:Uncharacterized protein n=1 Tax=Caerostris extrusa TaxID=172846 RepID=A0AAV4NRA6_CAEEX|nr:hypothetical protein CEXT_598051 [Caerostris extrusa]
MRKELKANLLVELHGLQGQTLDKIQRNVFEAIIRVRKFPGNKTTGIKQHCSSTVTDGVVELTFDISGLCKLAKKARLQKASMTLLLQKPPATKPKDFDGISVKGFVLHRLSKSRSDICDSFTPIEHAIEGI